MRPLSRFSGNRTILYVGIAVCIVGAVVVAILLGALDRPGWRSG
jgi:hypothetical protein